MGWLHRHGLRVTLNVHPADGVRPFEEAYRPMAEALGKDWQKEETVEFDITDPQFLQAYFKYLHHPNEEAGVDFWWVGLAAGHPDEDPWPGPPLDAEPLPLFGQYAGGQTGVNLLPLRRHRQPPVSGGLLGGTPSSPGNRWPSSPISPPTPAMWATAGGATTSAAICRATGDDELSTRWVQFGVFSPIMRLHSSNSAFTGKEPWNYNPVAEAVMKRYLRLRHQLVPYLYTMNYYASRKGQPLIRPMYYLEPERAEAYEVPNEYYFGTQLIACPITAPMDKKAGAAAFEAWLPEGKWFDLFNGRVYDGGRKLRLYRGVEDIPVLAKAGAILPLAELEPYTNSIDNPAALRVKIFAGAAGAFDLYEDDGVGAAAGDAAFAVTHMTWDGACFAVRPAEGKLRRPAGQPDLHPGILRRRPRRSAPAAGERPAGKGRRLLRRGAPYPDPLRPRRHPGGQAGSPF